MNKFPFSFLLFFLISICFQGVAQDSSQILYLLKKGNVPKAFELYDQHKSSCGQHDLDVVQGMGLALLQQGNLSRDKEIQLLTLFGAGISLNECALNILEEGIKSFHPELQLVSLNFLTKLQHDESQELINALMSSPFLEIRLEAALCLAKTKHPKASYQIEALLQKVPPLALPIFPQLLAICGDKNSIKTLQKLLSHPNQEVRTEAILATAKYGRDDLLPFLRVLSQHVNVAVQEASAIALGILKDESSTQRLKVLAKSKTVSVKLAALSALFELGREEALEEIEQEAKKENLFAIYLLKSMPGCQSTLFELLKSDNKNVRLNATLALLKLKSPVCQKGLLEILIKDEKDLGFAKLTSLGRGLIAWKYVPSAKQNFKEKPIALETSLRLREETLIQATELQERIFLQIADHIFQADQNALIPLLTELLTSIASPKAVELLKKYRQKIGSPLIRAYCNLALFRLNETGPYFDEIKKWIISHYNLGLIQFRPLLQLKNGYNGEHLYQLTPRDASKLLIDSLEALVQKKESQAIDILIEAIRYGNHKNRYAIAGLLMRAAH